MHGWPPQSGARALIKARHWGGFRDGGTTFRSTRGATRSARDFAGAAAVPASARCGTFGAGGVGHRCRDAVHRQHLLLPRLGHAGDVDVRRFHHAGSRFGAHQERLGDLPEERRALLFHCRDHVLPDRLQPDVHRCGQLHRLVPVLPHTQRGGADAARRRRCGGDNRIRLFERLQLVLPDGVRGHHRVDHLRHAGGAGAAVVFPGLHGRAHGRHLPRGGGVDLGRRLALPARLPRLRRFHRRPLDGRLGGAGGCHHGGAAAAQIPCRRLDSHHATFQRAHRHLGASSSSGSAGSASTADRSSPLAVLRTRWPCPTCW